jgi:hypothetical protein
MKYALRWFTGIAAFTFLVIFTAVLILSFHLRQGISFAVKKYVPAYIESEFADRIDPDKAKHTALIVGKLLDERLPDDTVSLEMLKERFRAELQSAIEESGWKKEDLRELYRTSGDQYREFDINRAKQENDYLGRWVRYRFISTRIALAREIRIYMVSNILIFLSLFLLAFNKRYANNIYPLMIAVIVSAAAVYSYFFRQDWAFKLLQQEFSNYGYLAGLALLLLWIWIPDRNRPAGQASVKINSPNED